MVAISNNKWSTNSNPYKNTSPSEGFTAYEHAWDTIRLFPGTISAHVDDATLQEVLSVSDPEDQKYVFWDEGGSAEIILTAGQISRLLGWLREKENVSAKKELVILLNNSKYNNFHKSRYSLNFKINNYKYKLFVNINSRLPLSKDSQQPSPSLDTPAASLKRHAARLPQEYTQRSASLADLNHAYRRTLAEELAVALSASAQAMEHDTIDSKRKVAAFVNEELRRFGMAIRFVKDGQEYPASMVAHTEKYTPNGRFRLEYKTPDGKTHRALFAEDVPDLELMDAPPRREPLKWVERATKQSDVQRAGK